MAAKSLVFCGFECSTSNENWQAETRGFENQEITITAKNIEGLRTPYTMFLSRSNLGRMFCVYLTYTIIHLAIVSLWHIITPLLHQLSFWKSLFFTRFKHHVKLHETFSLKKTSRNSKIVFHKTRRKVDYVLGIQTIHCVTLDCFFAVALKSI